jgi:hypothetical protein
VRPAQETGPAPPGAQQSATRPADAHVLSDGRYQTLKEYQRARNAAPPAQHHDRPQGTGKPQGGDTLPGTAKATGSEKPHGAEHANGADRTGTPPDPEVPPQRPPGPARSAEPGKHPDGTAITHIHWDFQDTNNDIYTAGARSAYLYSPTGKPHLDDPLGSEDGDAAKWSPAALPQDVSRYLAAGDRPLVIPVVGEKPDKSHGEELSEPDDSKKSRMERLRVKAESSEVLGDAPDSAQQLYDATYQILDARHPQGATVQAASDSPHIHSPVADQPGLGDIAYASVGMTILCVELGRKIHDMLRHKEKG